MIRSRPGFHPVEIDDSPRAKAPAPAKVQADMEPAFHRHSRAQPPKPDSPLVHSPQGATAPVLPDLQARAEYAMQKLREKAASQPEIIENPTPSATPIITSPHK